MANQPARREFIALLGGAVASCPVAAWAQQPQDQVRTLLGRIVRLQAEHTAKWIVQFIEDIKSQVGWTTQVPWTASAQDQRRFDALRLLRQVPAITGLSQIDSHGKERLSVSRRGMDRIEPGTDFSEDPKFTEAVSKKVYYGPVYFIWQSEPYMTLAMAGARSGAGVSVAEVSLKFIQDLVTKIKVGEHGVACVIDNQGRVIAHSNVNLIRKQFSDLGHVQAAHPTGRIAAGGRFRSCETTRAAKPWRPLSLSAGPAGWYSCNCQSRTQCWIIDDLDKETGKSSRLRTRHVMRFHAAGWRAAKNANRMHNFI